MIVIIRKSEVSDLDKLLEFEQELITSERPYDKSIKSENTTYYDLEELITNKNCHLVVAEHEGELIACGFSLIKKSDPFEKNDHFAYFGFMFVTPKYRRNGINKQILDSLIAWSKSKKIIEIRLEVFDKNQSAILAYEKLGFSKTLIQMRTEIT